MHTRIGWLAASVLVGAGSLACSDSAGTVAADIPTSRDLGAPAVAQQSPIDIEHHDLRVVGKHDLSAIKVHYSRHATLDIENTGSPEEESTVRANVTAGDGTLRIDGREYRLVQFHFHEPAEHEVDGVRYPMEMHMVHSAADGSTLVVGVLLKAGDVNLDLAPILDHLPAHAGEHATAAHFDIATLLPHKWESARYVGSLTTPPFTEGVRWIVVAPPVEVSRHQLDEFAALFPHGNSREVQPLNGRNVVTDDRDFEHDEGVRTVVARASTGTRH